MYVYSTTLIHVRSIWKLPSFAFFSLLVVGRLLFHQKVAHFSVKWVSLRTFRAFVLWKDETPISTFRKEGIHGYVLRHAAKWIDWHAHLRGTTENSHLKDRDTKQTLWKTRPIYFETNRPIKYR